MIYFNNFLPSNFIDLSEIPKPKRLFFKKFPTEVSEVSESVDLTVKIFWNIFDKIFRFWEELISSILYFGFLTYTVFYISY